MSFVFVPHPRNERSLRGLRAGERDRVDAPGAPPRMCRTETLTCVKTGVRRAGTSRASGRQPGAGGLSTFAATCPPDRQWRWKMDRFRSEEHTSELPSLMRISYDGFCGKKKKPL